MVKNYMEQLMENELDKMLSDDHYEFVCRCDSCLDSIRAITLNAIKPFYVTSKTGEVFGTYRNMEVQNKCDLITELIKAKELVAKNPKH